MTELIEQLTEQEIYDRACTGLAKQGFRQSRNRNEGCAYRGDEGRRCAIGHCLTDDEIGGEEGILGCLPIAGRLRLGLFMASDPGTVDAESNAERWDFCLSLQKVHDRNVGELMRQELLSFGKYRGLEIPVHLQEESGT